MQHDGEAGQTLGYLFQDVEAQRRGHQDAVRVAGALRGGELVRAVAGADGDGQAVARRWRWTNSSTSSGRV